MHYNFEWDPNKARSNLSKHGVSFKQAAGVFLDPMTVTVPDPDTSSQEEERWITLGQAAGQHYLVVVHTHREENSDIVSIRIISARRASRHEIRQYEQG
ncbi:MAG: BrnT family toxin [Pseudomonadales bacterium]|nr:BrnT family toxin [Pseudomonadales bacterium]